MNLEFALALVEGAVESGADWRSVDVCGGPKTWSNCFEAFQ